MSDTKVISVIGLKNSGKTRLVRAMLAQWTAQNLRVAVVKHDGHAVPGEVAQWQKINSDTQLFAEGGAAYTLLAGGDRTLLYNARDNYNHDIRKLLQRVENQAATDGNRLDMIIVEGFKDSTLPKVAVIRTQEQLDWLIYERPLAIAGVVMPDELIHLAEKSWRVYHENDTVALCHDLLQLDGGE